MEEFKNGWMAKQADRLTNRQTDGQIDRHTHIQTDRQADR